MSDGPEPSIRVPVKDLIKQVGDELGAQLIQVISRLDSLTAKLDGKASEVRVDGLEKRIKDMEDEIVDLRLARAGSAALTGAMKIAFAGVGATVIGSLISLVILATHGGHL